MSDELITDSVRKRATVATYDIAARGYAQKFDHIGPRVEDVDKGFALLGKENPMIVEIGCGNGREAEYVLSKVTNDRYVGFDVSKEMIALAKERLPEANFVIADVAEFDFPKNTDIVFALASLLHSSKEELAMVLKRIHLVLNENGVVYISLKRRDVYQDEMKEDEYGPRHFFYYTKKDVLEAAGEGYEEVYYDEQELQDSWLTIVLRKIK